MIKLNSAEFPLNNQTKFMSNKINKIKDYFSSEIQERKTMNKKLSKYIAAFDCIDKTLIGLSATSGRISIISFTRAIGVPAGLGSASFTLTFSLTTGIIKKLLKITRKKKKKHNRIAMLAKSKLNSVETLVSQALIDLDISHEEFKTIVNEKEKYEQMKESIRNIKSIRNKGYALNWSEEIFVVKKIKNTAPWTYVISGLNGEKIIGSFYEKELQKTNKKEFRIEKLRKTKGNKLYVEWKGYINSFNSWIHKKYIIK